MVKPKRRLIGSMRGPRDASTNKRYLEEALIADYTKHDRRRRTRRKMLQKLR